ncbi:alpha-L-fucosidase [Salegentibacter salegens]
MDSRPVSDWFQDIKFGIFIHCGLIRYRSVGLSVLIRNGTNNGCRKN